MLSFGQLPRERQLHVRFVFWSLWDARSMLKLVFHMLPMGRNCHDPCYVQKVYKPFVSIYAAALSSGNTWILALAHSHLDTDTWILIVGYLLTYTWILALTHSLTPGCISLFALAPPLHTPLHTW